jgi:hypothetical protein
LPAPSGPTSARKVPANAASPNRRPIARVAAAAAELASPEREADRATAEGRAVANV